MKQHITQSDLEQLSDKGKDAYARYITKLPKADWELLKIIERVDSMSYLSIGQMIEFLSEQEELHNGWYMKEGVIDIDYSDELCDALWEACKEVLEV